MRPALTLVVLRCADLAESRAFYEGLGLEFVEEQHGAGPRHLAATLAGGVVVELYPASSGAASDMVRLGIETDVLAAAVLLDPDGRQVETHPWRRRGGGPRHRPEPSLCALAQADGPLDDDLADGVPRSPDFLDIWPGKMSHPLRMMGA